MKPAEQGQGNGGGEVRRGTILDKVQGTGLEEMTSEQSLE